MAAARDVIGRQRIRSFNRSLSPPPRHPATNKLGTADRNLTYICDSGGLIQRRRRRMFSLSPPSCFFLFCRNSRFFFLPPSNFQIMFGIWRPQTRTHGLITLDVDYVGGRGKEGKRYLQRVPTSPGTVCCGGEGRWR